MNASDGLACIGLFSGRYPRLLYSVSPVSGLPHWYGAVLVRALEAWPDRKEG